MHILSKRNGIALMGVLTVLLVLTLLLPVMFTMSTSAVKDAVKGQDGQRASYLARTMAEMAVSAFQEVYDEAEQEKKNGNINGSSTTQLNRFYEDTTMNAGTLYMFRRTSADYKWTEAPTDKDDYEEWLEKQYEACFYSTKAPSATIGEYQYDEVYTVAVANEEDSGTHNVEGYFIGQATCEITYDGEPEYYKVTNTTVDGEVVYNEPEPCTKEEYTTFIQSKTGEGVTITATEVKYIKVENRQVEFVATGVVNGKSAQRRCIAVLPTKPAEQSWIVPAEIESNQIFVDSTQASSVTVLSNVDTNESSQNQPVYIFSCLGNMVLSTDELTFKITSAMKLDWNIVKGGDFATTVGEVGDYISYKDYAEYYRLGYFLTMDAPANISDYSLGVHPITTTRNPENDPNFNCVKTNNMASWARSAQRDNFVAFTATNGIKVEMPINLLINPTRTGRIGDGVSENKSLYKVMYFQSPTIVFKGEVNTFVSLYQNTTLGLINPDYNGNRMSTIVLAAPENSPYSYYNEDRGTNVRAGRVYFMEDAYVWLVPFSENGSDYNTQTVYYKGSDIILYKFANAGDVYLFNAEVSNDGQDSSETQGFSITNYFMDVIYNHTETDNNNWWNIWNSMMQWIFDTYRDKVTSQTATYLPNDLYYEGNVNESPSFAPPANDGLYIVWDS